MREYIQNLHIKDCNSCVEIQRVQRDHHINIAPLFWQGQGRTEIPLVIMGINPSAVGTANEPQRGCDFNSYYDYYQNRVVSEAQNINLAKAHIPPIGLPVGGARKEPIPAAPVLFWS